MGVGAPVHLDSTGDQLGVSLKGFTAPTQPQACADGAFVVKTSDDGFTSHVAAVATSTAIVGCNTLQVQTYHGPIASFIVTVPDMFPTGGNVGLNIALKGENRTVQVTARDSLGNPVDGQNGGTPFLGDVTLSTNPGVNPTFSSLLIPEPGCTFVTPNVIRFGAGNNSTCSVQLSTGLGSAGTQISATSGAVSTSNPPTVLVADPVLSITTPVNGGANETHVMWGTGFWGPQYWTINHDTAQIGGSPAIHPPIVLNAQGMFGNTTLTR